MRSIIIHDVTCGQRLVGPTNILGEKLAHVLLQADTASSGFREQSLMISVIKTQEKIDSHDSLICICLKGSSEAQPYKLQ